MFIITNNQLQAIDEEYISQKSVEFYIKYKKKLAEKYGADKKTNISQINKMLLALAESDIIKLEHWEDLLKSDLSYPGIPITEIPGIENILHDNFTHEVNKVDVMKNFVEDQKIETNGR